MLQRTPESQATTSKYRELQEDLLERVWFAREDGRTLAPDAPELNRRENAPAALSALLGTELMRLENERLVITAAGEEVARRIVRRHRLCEEMLSVVLMLEGKDLIKTACGVEHVLNPAVTESICTLLGHPTVCPHGRPIPPGPCCERADTTVRPLVERLTDLPVGTEARIVFMTPAQRKKLARLVSMGLAPGAMVRVQQKKPAYVVQVGETTLAVDESLLAEVFVRSPAANGDQT